MTAREIKSCNTEPPTTSSASTIMLLTLSCIFGIITFWPLAPSLDSLNIDTAYVEKIFKTNLMTTTTKLKTNQGHSVRCHHDKTGGCHPDIMKHLLQNTTPIIIWHDGAMVYQMIAQDKLILAYEHSYQGRWFSAAISITLFIIAIIQLAIRTGIIGTARNPTSRP